MNNYDFFQLTVIEWVTIKHISMQRFGANISSKVYSTFQDEYEELASIKYPFPTGG